MLYSHVHSLLFHLHRNFLNVSPQARGTVKSTSFPKSGYQGYRKPRKLPALYLLPKLHKNPKKQDVLPIVVLVSYDFLVTVKAAPH